MFTAFSTALALALTPSVGPAGSYLEARTCDVFTGPCFANADTGLTGRHAVMAWKIDAGTFAGADLGGLQVVAVVAAGDTLGQRQLKQARSVLVVDGNADELQKSALIAFAKSRAGGLLDKVIDIRSADIEMDVCPCSGDSCATLKAGDEVRVQTRCLDADHDRGCGNESRYYEPLAAGVKAVPAMAVEHAFTGKGFDQTWVDAGRRGAYVGTFGK